MKIQLLEWTADLKSNSDQLIEKFNKDKERFQVFGYYVRKYLLETTIKELEKTVEKLRMEENKEKIQHDADLSKQYERVVDDVILINKNKSLHVN